MALQWSQDKGAEFVPVEENSSDLTCDIGVIGEFPIPFVTLPVWSFRRPGIKAVFR